jgi:protein-tyrosine phosphatase
MPSKRPGGAPAWNGSRVACSGGRGRTGTALACLAILDGMSPQQAVDFVRENYNSKAIETPWQRRFVMQFGC